MDSKDANCKDVLTIPQFTGTCWFNALLMAMFYSDGFRAYLKTNLINSKLFIKNKKLYDIFIDILNNKYRNIHDNDNIFFDELKPEKLLKLLHQSNQKLFYFDPDKYSGHWGENYLVKLFDYFGLKNKMLFLSRNEKDNTRYLYSKLNNKIIVYKIKTRNGKETVQASFGMKELTKEQKRKTLERTDFDVLVVTQKNYSSFDHYNELFTIPSSDIQEVIEFNGISYKLDSMLLTNFNSKVCNKYHQIAGVTCNNQRYMYNGWMRDTKDPAKQTTVHSYSDRNKACELMKYDWLSNKDDFCLSPKACKIENRSSRNELCFNTTDHPTFIYVRVPEHNKTVKLLSKNLSSVTKECAKDVARISEQLLH